MDFKNYLKKGVELIKLNRDVAGEVAANEGSFGPAILFFAIGGLAGGIGSTLGTAGFGAMMLVAGPVFAVLVSFVYVGVLHLLAGLFGGRADYKAYYSALGIGSMISWASVIPVLGALVALWRIPVAVIVTERVQNISLGRAVAVVLIPIALLIAIALVLVALIGVAAFMGMAGMAEHGM